jgi:AcrR family transcriptional regulator
MARQRSQTRIEELIEAATTVFIARGYRRTQMADVAAALDLSPGALYRYVESKEALFDLCLRAAAGRVDTKALPSPLPSPPPGATLAFVQAVVEQEGHLPALGAALELPAAADPAGELATIVRHLYGLMSHHRRGIALVERSALDWPELAALWFGGLRARLIDDLARYLARRAGGGQFRRPPDVTSAARLMVEVCAFFALHRHADPAPTSLDDATAEATVVDALVHAYVCP